VNITVEVALVRKLHSELEDKKRRAQEMHLNRSATSVSSVQNTNSATVGFRRKRKTEIEIKAEQRTIIMVVINAFINFFFRLPELFFLFSISDDLFNENILSEVFNSLVSLGLFWTDLTYFAYILTFSTNFVMYFLFNRKFKKTFFSEWKFVRNR
jgi:hypothetical protein